MTIAGALATLSLMIAQPTDRPANDPPLIRINQGELTGVADGDIAAFKNIRTVQFAVDRRLEGRSSWLRAPAPLARHR